MANFHDIFSTEKIISKPKKQTPKEKIIIDYREKNSLVASELVSLGFKIEFTELKVADYIIKDTAIERKTVNDFLSSMINRRLINQLEEIKQYENKLLLIEGIDEQELYNDKNPKINANSIRGFLLSIALKHKIPIIFTKDYCDTAKFIELIARKKQTSFGIRAKKKSKNKTEQIQFILEGFPGIGPKAAKKLLQDFKSLKNIFNAKSEEIIKSIGKKGEVIKKVVEMEY